MDLRAEPDRWSSIPEGILFVIASKMECIDDYIRLCVVCRSWYLLATDFYNTNLKQTLKSRPLFMSRTNPNSKRITLQNPVSGDTTVRDLPESAGSECWGSPFGWLITCDPIGLLNPFTGATIALPPLPESSVIKAFLTADPDSDPDHCLVFCLFSYQELAFVRPARDTEWSYLVDRFELCCLVCFQGNLYGLESSYDSFTTIFSSQLNGRLVQDFVPFLNEEIQYGGDDFEKHLVDLNGQLCLCVRHHHHELHSTISFKIYEINLSTKKLTQVFTLGDHCLFLGSTYSLCKPTYPPHKRLKRPDDEHAHCEFVSNYVFCTYDHNWVGLTACHNRPFEVEVWDMLNSRKVYGVRSSSTSLFGPHWIFQSANFPKLEDAPKSIPFPTPEQSCYLQKLEDAPKPIPTPTPTRELLSCFQKLGDAFKSAPTNRQLMWVGNSAFLIFVFSHILGKK